MQQKQIEQQEHKKKTGSGKWISGMLFILMATACQILTLELSSAGGMELGVPGILEFFLTRSPIYNLVSFMTIFMLDALLLWAFGNVGYGLTASSLVITALAVTNYFVFLLHGTPFTLDMIRNTGTAMKVLQSYSLHMDMSLLGILLLSVFVPAASLIFFRKQKIQRRKMILPLTVLMILAAVNYIIPGSVIPKGAVKWSWGWSIGQVGYLNCLIEETVHSGQVVKKPLDYDEEKIRSFTESYEKSREGSQSPDVLLILNETFFDLSQVTDVDADGDYLKNIHGLPNAVTGYAVVPAVGGGTNKSEYEYLTGNSLQLAPNVTPFNALDLEDHASVVSLLKQQGYTSQAVHTEPGSNYNRTAGYPAMGFDRARFEEDFQNMDHYGERTFRTDASLYENVFKWYEEMDQAPRLFYALTIQNHGGYEQLSENNYRIHTGRDFGENTSLVHEFLTMISLSDEAFMDIVEYFSKSQRDVIVCMVGDHAPSFIRSVVDEDLTAQEKELRMRSVPYVIWSNHLEISQELPERISMNYLVPTVLDMAGIQLSPYYDYMLSMRDQVPVLSSYGVYMDAQGNTFSYGDSSEKAELVKIYQGLAYANMTGKPFMEAFSAP